MRNVAQFVIILCCVFLVGNVAHSFKFVVLYIFKEETASFANEYSAVADTLLFVSQSLNLALYYKFNACFRRTFRRIFSFPTVKTTKIASNSPQTN